MKYLLITIFLASNIFTFSQTPKETNNDSTIYVDIINIDSVGDNYIVYASTNKDKYKIIARKTKCNKKKIEVGRNYKINISQWFPNTLLLNPGYKYPIYGGEFTDIHWGNNLYTAKELCGLCYYSSLINSKECNKDNQLKELMENSVISAYLQFDIKTNLRTNMLIDSIMENKIEFEIVRKEIIINTSFFPDKPINKVIGNKENELIFKGFILLQYKGNCLVIINETANSDYKISGWVNKEYFYK